MSKIDVTQLTPDEKLELLKNLVDEMDIFITGHYGAYDWATSDDIRKADAEDAKHMMGCTVDSVIISTNINTG